MIKILIGLSFYISSGIGSFLIWCLWCKSEGEDADDEIPLIIWMLFHPIIWLIILAVIIYEIVGIFQDIIIDSINEKETKT